MARCLHPLHDMTLLSHFFLLLGCSDSVRFELPNPEMPTQAIVMREALQGPGSDRTGNWRGWFDADGCWWEEHNTWLVVTDPFLQQSSEPSLHWNAAPATEPWFCLNQEQLKRLRMTIDQMPHSGESKNYASAVDRWTVKTGDNATKVTVIDRNADGGQWAPMLDLFQQLAAMSVWGQSPEP